MKEVSARLKESDVVAYVVVFEADGTGGLVNWDNSELLMREALDLIC